jgi:hypothetical protein
LPGRHWPKSVREALTVGHLTVVVSLFLSAVAVSGAVLLILEMYTPFAGWIRVSSVPLRAALAHLGQ